jgi:hypothetical protein
MGNWGGHVLLDPSDLERMFSNDDSWNQLPSVFEEPTPEHIVQLDEVRDVLDMIPPREADFIELYFFQKLRQTTIAELYNVSQPTVCYRLARGATRLRYLIDMPVYDSDVLETDLKGVFSDPVDVKVMMGMLRTTCQSDVAKELGTSQGFVRHRFLRTISKMEALPTMDNYVKVFKHVASNINILKSSTRSSWGEELIFSLH